MTHAEEIAVLERVNDVAVLTLDDVITDLENAVDHLIRLPYGAARQAGVRLKVTLATVRRIRDRGILR